MAKPAKSHKGEIRNHRTAKSDRLPPEIHGLRLEAVCCGREFKTKGSRWRFWPPTSDSVALRRQRFDFAGSLGDCFGPLSRTSFVYWMLNLILSCVVRLDAGWVQDHDCLPAQQRDGHCALFEATVFFWVRLYQLHISKLGPPNGHRWRCSLSIERDLSTSSWNTKTLPRARGSWEEPGSLPWASGHTPRSFYMGVS